MYERDGQTHRQTDRHRMTAKLRLMLDTSTTFVNTKRSAAEIK